MFKKNNPYQYVGLRVLSCGPGEEEEAEDDNNEQDDPPTGP